MLIFLWIMFFVFLFFAVQQIITEVMIHRRFNKPLSKRMVVLWVINGLAWCFNAFFRAVVIQTNGTIGKPVIIILLMIVGIGFDICDTINVVLRYLAAKSLTPR